MSKLTSDKISAAIREAFPDEVVEEVAKNVDPFLVVRADRFAEIATFCRDDPRLRFDLLSCITGVDYPPEKRPPEKRPPEKRPPESGGEALAETSNETASGGAPGGVIEVIYCLDSTRFLHSLILKVRLPRGAPRIATVENVWRTADWHEREAFDLVGVEFVGHHNLIRILCAEDWVGHPLRRDYVAPDTYHGLKNVIY